ncbi:AraC family transcriptional regulator [Bacillus atrophaeus]|uniref:AraC family transcriptional regulator n=1 Tax=Bacillus atrophaeus TaxID=1452 RepID=UPI0030F3D426
MKKQPQNKERVSRWKGSYFKRNFVLILLIACIPGLLTGGAIYFLSIAKVEDELQRSHEAQVVREVNRIDEKLEGLELTLTQLAFDSALMNELTEKDIEKDFKLSYQLTKRLFLLRDQQPLIEQASVFLNSPRPLLLNPEYSRITEADALREYRSVLASDSNIYWKDTDGNFGSSSKAMLVQLIPGSAEKPFGAVMLTVNPKEMKAMLQSLSPYPDGRALLLNQKNDVLFQAGKKGAADFKNALIHEVKNQQKADGNFQMKWGGTVYSVSYGHIKRMHQEWTYASAAPLSSVTAPMVFLSKLIIAMIVICLGLALFMTWYASKKIYHPVQHLLSLFTGEEKKAWKAAKQDEFKWLEKRWNDLSSESRTLQQRISLQTPQMKKSFLQQLIQGDFYYHTEESLRSRMEDAGWDIRDKLFHVLDIQMTGLGSQESEFSAEDEHLAAFMLANITEELAASRFPHFSLIDIGRLSLTVLLVREHGSSVRDDIRPFAGDLTKAINRAAGLKVTGTISRKAGYVKDIPALYKDVKIGKSHRHFANRHQIIDLHDENQLAQHPAPYYPFELEKQILQAIRLERKEEAARLVSLFINELTEKAVKDMHVHPALVQLFSRIQEDILHSGLYPSELFPNRDMLRDISELRHPDQAVSWLMETVVSPYLAKLDGRKNRQQKQLTEHVIAMIHDQYMADLSLESCADAAGTNSYTLSKAFKQVTGTNFIDYVTDIRIEKAKELLVSTNKKIHDVSEEVGYRHSYFNRIFKKQVGMPPGVYRQMYQETS